MTDFIFVIFLALTILFLTPIAQQYEEQMKEEIEDVRAVNAMLWNESSILGERYDACKQQIRRKR